MIRYGAINFNKLTIGAFWVAATTTTGTPVTRCSIAGALRLQRDDIGTVGLYRLGSRFAPAP